MANFTNSYTKYFNTKYQRVGPLFQGVFKALHVESDEQLIHLSRYIHLNPVTGFMIKAGELRDYKWSSYPSYLDKQDAAFIEKQTVLSFFKGQTDYEKFVLDQVDYGKRLTIIEHLSIDSKVD